MGANDPIDWTLGVLCGGRSRRMGRSKAVLPFGASTLLEHVIRRCRSKDGPVLLAVGPRDDLPADLAPFADRVLDTIADGGPLAGIGALAARCVTRYLVVVPCDMPGVDAPRLERLLAPLRDGGADLAAYSRDGRPTPFPLAATAARVAAAAARRLLGDERSVLGLADDLPLEACAIAAGDTAFLANLNEPGDYEAAIKDFAS